MKSELVSAFGSQQEHGGCRFNRTLDAIRAGRGFAGNKDAARVKAESAVRFGV